MRYTLVIPDQIRLKILEGNIREVLLKTSRLAPNYIVELRVNDVPRLTACNGQIEHDFIDDFELYAGRAVSEQQQQEIASAWNEVRFVNPSLFSRFELLCLHAQSWFLRRDPLKKGSVIHYSLDLQQP